MLHGYTAILVMRIMESRTFSFMAQFAVDVFFDPNFYNQVSGVNGSILNNPTT